MNPPSLLSFAVGRVCRIALLALLMPASGWSMIGSPSLLADEGGDGFALVADGSAASIRASTDDWPGVLRAARDLQADVERVTGVKPVLTTDAGAKSATAVIIGTIGKSALIDGLVASGKIDVAQIRGKWEAF
ncbi:MAG TPA: hypothetical protein VMM36_04540, partial [Opitutaceae bacterium]|nr:hypothetical protein [Opitutaceae bacterium]